MLIDYEFVDMNLLLLLQQLNNMDNALLMPSFHELSGTSKLLEATESLRREVAQLIETQGTVSEPVE